MKQIKPTQKNKEKLSLFFLFSLFSFLFSFLAFCLEKLRKMEFFNVLEASPWLVVQASFLLMLLYYA